MSTDQSTSTVRTTGAASPDGDRRADRHPAQWLALAVGLLYLLAGLGGFLLTGFDGFTDPEGELLLGIFEVNPLHNLVHVVIGLAGVALWNRLAQARLFGWLLVAAYGPAFAYGLFVASSDQPENFLALNQPDNWLHAASVVAGLAIALWPANRDHGTAARPRH